MNLFFIKLLPLCRVIDFQYVKHSSSSIASLPSESLSSVCWIEDFFSLIAPVLNLNIRTLPSSAAVAKSPKVSETSAPKIAPPNEEISLCKRA